MIDNDGDGDDDDDDDYWFKKFFFLLSSGELITFHETQAITALGGELLRIPCRISCIPDIFRGLTIYAAR